MKEKDNVGKYNQCYGCGVCSVICPTEIIDIRLNEDGFLTPHISNNDKCINCGLCLRVCSYNKENLFENIKPVASYGGWSNNPENRLIASSGGIAGEISDLLIPKGFNVCAVEYDTESETAKHFITDKLACLHKAVGSKYIQSNTLPAFNSFIKGKRYLIIGTPCQIDTLRRYISIKKLDGEFVFVDFFCHGTPSYLAWKKYLEIVKKQIGNITFINWRNKKTGWHDSWAIGANSDDNSSNQTNSQFKYYSRFTKGDLFYNLFLGDYCMNPACCDACKYKYDHSCADIRIGDFWGPTYKKDEKGVSSIVTFTHKGNDIIEQLKDSCTIIPYPFTQAAEGQMKKNVSPSFFTPLVMKMLKSNEPLNLPLLKIIFFFRFLRDIPLRVLLKLKSIIRNNA